MPAEISVTPLPDEGYEVLVTDGGHSTRHRVTADKAFVDTLGLGEVDETELVRESFRFLLKREPASSILPRFDLSVIAGYFPEYPAAIVRAISSTRGQAKRP